MKFFNILLLQLLSYNYIYSQIIDITAVSHNENETTNLMGYKYNASINIDSLLGELEIGETIGNYIGVYLNQSDENNYYCLYNWYTGDSIYFNSTLKSIKNFRSFGSDNELFFECVLQNYDSLQTVSIRNYDIDKSLNDDLDYIELQYNHCQNSTVIGFENLGFTLDQLFLIVEDSPGRFLTSINIKFKDDLVSTTGSFSEIKNNIYPNPTSGELYFNNFMDNQKVKIFDVHGKLISQSIVLENKLDVSGLNNGLYMLMTESGQLMKFVKIE